MSWFRKGLDCLLGRNKKDRSRLGYLFIWIRNLLLFSIISSFLAVLYYSYFPVRVTPLMLIRSVQNFCSGKDVRSECRWIPIEQMPSSMIEAVVASEDNHFMTHSGFDLDAIAKARELNKKGKKVYGASTISQQTAKNVFLWPSRTYVRKALEAYFTVLIETIWSKKRIMEVYLNVVEMGDGIYGIEAAGRHYFKCSAKRMSLDQCVSVAVCLPNPRFFHADKLTPQKRTKKERIKNLMKKLNRTEWGFGK